MSTSETIADPTTVQDALATGLLSTDAARRVGWAKAFEALRRIDGLEEELRVARDERKHLRRAYSRLVGFVHTLPGTRSSSYDQEIRSHFEAERLFRDDDAFMSGEAAARRHAVEAYGLEVYEVASIFNKIDEDVAALQELAAVRREATAAGHTIHRWATDDESFEVTCSCGEKAVVPSRNQVRKWADNHNSMVARGKTRSAVKHAARRQASKELKKALDMSTGSKLITTPADPEPRVKKTGPDEMRKGILNKAAEKLADQGKLEINDPVSLLRVWAEDEDRWERGQ